MATIDSNALYFYWNGFKSTEEGIVVTSMPTITKPQRKYDEEIFDYSDGSSIHTYGLEPFDLTLELAYVGTYHTGQVWYRNFLDTKFSVQPTLKQFLVLSNDIDEDNDKAYGYEARIVNSIEMNLATSRFYTFSVTWRCQPKKLALSISGTSPNVSVTEEIYTISNFQSGGYSIEKYSLYDISSKARHPKAKITINTSAGLSAINTWTNYYLMIRVTTQQYATPDFSKSNYCCYDRYFIFSLLGLKQYIDSSQYASIVFTLFELYVDTSNNKINIHATYTLDSTEYTIWNLDASGFLIHSSNWPDKIYLYHQMGSFGQYQRELISAASDFAYTLSGGKSTSSDSDIITFYIMNASMEPQSTGVALGNIDYYTGDCST